jgi:hypothetical protein
MLDTFHAHAKQLLRSHLVMKENLYIIARMASRPASDLDCDPCSSFPQTAV